MILLKRWGYARNTTMTDILLWPKWGCLYATRMNLYNLRFRMVILIPFLTQPPHERTLTGRGSQVYPNVGAAVCTLTSGNHTVYEFALNNLYNNCMNSFVWICTKISEKKICIRVGISTRDQYPRLKSSRSAIHHPAPSVSGHFIYIP